MVTPSMIVVIGRRMARAGNDQFMAAPGVGRVLRGTQTDLHHAPI